MLPVIIQAASPIVLFLKKGGCFLKRFECGGKIGDFLLTNNFNQGTMSRSAKLVLSVSKRGLSPTLPSLVPCLSMKLG